LAEDRLVPDIVRGCLGVEGVLRLRNPEAVRPWQHVLEPLHAYLMLAERLCAGEDAVAEAWNIGPEAGENRSVSDVASAIVAALGRGRIEVTAPVDAPHEAHLLALDCAKARTELGWLPRIDFAAAIALTASWYSAWAKGADMVSLTRQQIVEFTESAA
jgi:CDP-glucose 4,6-dehydratase